MRGKSRLTGRRRRVNRVAVAGLVGALAITAGAASSAPAASQRSHSAPHPSRVEQLVSRMTLDEKLQMLSGGPEDAATNEYEAGYLPGIPRLGIPSLRFTDGPPGVATRRLSTGMTQTMGVAATFSREDAWLNGRVIGRDARALGQDVMLEPFINLDRDPAAGRTWNTFGEDPVLSGALGAETIAGIQSQGVMAQAKHYIGFDGPNGNVVVDQQTLHEVYLKPFEDAVDAGVSSVMCAYNRINGDGSCDSPTMLDTVLKGQLGFKGFVTSDWGATHATDDISSGLDLEMPGANTYGGVIPAYMTPAQLNAAIAAGTVQDTRIDDAVRRILGQYERFGFLDGAQKHTVTDEAIEPNARVVLRTGEDAATLLKNDDRALPLNARDLASLAMIGPGAGQTMATGGGGEKATGRAERWIGTVDALKRTTRGAHLTYAVADDMSGTPIPASALSHDGEPGLVRTTVGSPGTRVDAQIAFSRARGTALPAGSAHSWTGTLTAPESGTYWINFGELGTTGSVAIDGATVIRSDAFVGSAGPRLGTVKAGDAGVLPSTTGLNNKRAQVALTAGPHTLTVNQAPDVSGAPVEVELNWVTPSQQQANYAAALDAARHAGTAVVFAWSTGSLATSLPEGQDQLIADVAAANPNTIVVLNTHQPVAMPWLSQVKAVLNMWFPGDEGGWATANVLVGKANPAGRLPFTWPVTLSQNVANDPAHPERASRGVNPGTTTPCTNTAGGVGAVPNCDTLYSEGVDIGYRWFDRQGLTPLFPFGHGLSYGDFSYSRLTAHQSHRGELRVTFTITNHGVAGEEVPQIYLGAPVTDPAGVQFPVRALAAFDRVYVGAGRSARVRIDVPARELSYWSTAANRWTRATGKRSVYVGSSSRDVRLTTDVTIR
jgi:beta-glucosidase